MDFLAKIIMSIFHFHQWGKWTGHRASMGQWQGGQKIRDFEQPYQQRICKTCGLVEQRNTTYFIK